jgi:hypothetical protein
MGLPARDLQLGYQFNLGVGGCLACGFLLESVPQHIVRDIGLLAVRQHVSPHALSFALTWRHEVERSK